MGKTFTSCMTVAITIMSLQALHGMHALIKQQKISNIWSPCSLVIRL